MTWRLPDDLDLTDGRLRAVEPADWRLDQALSRVPDVTRWTYYPADASEEVAQARVARNIELRRDGRGGRFIIESGGVPVGTIGISLRIDGPYLYYALLPGGPWPGARDVGGRRAHGLGVRRRVSRVSTP